MKINLGSGFTRIDGFVNVDFDARTKPDFVCDLEKDKLPFDNDTVEVVMAHHVLEHMGEGYFHCMQEIYRVCKHGASVDVRVPHPRHWAFLADPTHRRPIIPEGLQLFSKKFNDAHKDSSASQLGHYFNVNFELSSVSEIPDPNYVNEFVGMPSTTVQKYLREHNNIVMEYHIRLLVVKDE